MIFLSTGFAVFLAAVLVLAFLAPPRIKPAVLLAASLFFYGFFCLSFLLLLLIQIVFVYVCARGMGKCVGLKRKSVLLLSVLGVLGPLFVLKYLNFIIRSVVSLFSSTTSEKPLAWLGLILPVGISFYTFKSLSYLLEVYHGRLAIEKNPIRLGLYISFFPQILAGPIDRARNFLSQLPSAIVFNPAHLSAGLKLLAWGLFKKIVVADQLARYVNVVFDRPQDFQGLGLLAGLIFYSFQIYCDFSGYSDMAVGLAKTLGLDTMDNFRYPYFSRSIAEFWGRWHISLSSWLRDYLFLPMAYALSRKIKAERFLLIKTEFLVYGGAMGITMLLCGLWHGPSWTFVLWGGLHAFYLITSRATKKARSGWLRRLHLRPANVFLIGWKMLTTFCLVTLAWVLFRSPSLSQAWLYLRSISFQLPRSGIGQLLYLGSLLFIFIVADAVMKSKDKIRFLKNIPVPVQAMVWALFLCLIIILAADTSNEFLYFQF
jgi:alginate O-acetyltransferase complex protein AlgI